MNLSEHEYLLPIIIGNDKGAIAAAREIHKKTGARVRLFAQRFSLWQRFCFECRTVDPMRDDFLLESLISYLGSIEEYYCPVIIICDERARGFVKNFSKSVESACLAVEYKDFFNNQRKGKENTQ